VCDGVRGKVDEPKPGSQGRRGEVSYKGGSGSRLGLARLAKKKGASFAFGEIPLRTRMGEEDSVGRERR